ncbi:MAG TPA: tRNA epoxyqueuosine(34) reductase QueG [Chloroflexota bacterium]|jgi:epoxyqueuosine reductase|nr:tRNA epoxyqueuosine(34) reductase QueG [Chloroflexota bacterium]
MPDPLRETAAIKALALEAGFDLVGITSAAPFPALHDLLLERIRQGLMGGLAWFTADRAAVASDVQQLVPTARSIISLAMSYLGDDAYLPSTPGTPRGRVARYAWGRDYHPLLLQQTARFIEQLRLRYGHSDARRGMVDTARIVDRAVAQRAGVGWYGKNTCILTHSYGSWVLLAEVVTDLELAPDRPVRTTCGACTRCMPACPTGALIRPGVMDVGRCISYLTIEERGAIAPDLRTAMGDWIFGCDVCQEVCPVNRKAPAAARPEFGPAFGIGPSPELLPLLTLTPAEFAGRFAGTPIKRAKRSGLLRNVCVALGNIGDPVAIPALGVALTSDAEPLVRAHAAWALGRWRTGAARPYLDQARQREREAAVYAEIETALAGAGSARA